MAANPASPGITQHHQPGVPPVLPQGPGNYHRFPREGLELKALSVRFTPHCCCTYGVGTMVLSRPT
eukprot:6903559-Alexandrium_andersonii.AAC.1